MPARIGLPIEARVLLLGSDSTLEADSVGALRSESCEVLLAADCRQALDLARTGPINLLVLDFGACSRKFSQLASIFNSANGRCLTLVLADSLEQMALANETGADGVLIKPLDPIQLSTMIHRLLAGFRTQPLAGTWPPDTVARSELGQIPNGYTVGRRAPLAEKP